MILVGRRFLTDLAPFGAIRPSVNMRDMDDRARALNAFGAAVQEFAPGVPWQFVKKFGAVPHLKFTIKEPFGAMVQVKDGRWWLWWLDPAGQGAANRDFASVTDPHEVAFERMLNAFQNLVHFANRKGDVVGGFFYGALMHQIALAYRNDGYRAIAVAAMKDYAIGSGFEAVVLEMSQGIDRDALPEWLLPRYDETIEFMKMAR